MSNTDTIIIVDEMAAGCMVIVASDGIQRYSCPLSDYSKYKYSYKDLTPSSADLFNCIV